MAQKPSHLAAPTPAAAIARAYARGRGENPTPTSRHRALDTADAWTVDDRVAALHWPDQAAATIRRTPTLAAHYTAQALLDADVLFTHGMPETARQLVTAAAAAYREVTR